jgi:rare lipoprotein A
MRIFITMVLMCFGVFMSLEAQTQTGIASVRPLAHEGFLTKSGEFFSHDSLVASHRSIPFGSIVKITNLKNQKSVDVRINDRGPFINGHIIDLSEVVGLQIGLNHEGLAKVRLDILKLEKDFKIKNFENLNSGSGEYTIKLGSFGDKNNAENYAKSIIAEHKIQNTIVKADQVSGKTIYRVYIGKFETRSIAEQYLTQLPEDLQSGYVTTFQK